MTHRDNLEQDIRQALANAVENGTDFNGWSSYAIAMDLCSYDVNFECEAPEDIAPLIEEIAPTVGITLY